MVYAVRDEMQDAYPELKETADRVAKVVEAEEEQFARSRLKLGQDVSSNGFAAVSTADSR